MSLLHNISFIDKKGKEQFSVKSGVCYASVRRQMISNFGEKITGFDINSADHQVVWLGYGSKPKVDNLMIRSYIIHMFQVLHEYATLEDLLFPSVEDSNVSFEGKIYNYNRQKYNKIIIKLRLNFNRLSEKSIIFFLMLLKFPHEFPEVFERASRIYKTGVGWSESCWIAQQTQAYIDSIFNSNHMWAMGSAGWPNTYGSDVYKVKEKVSPNVGGDEFYVGMMEHMASIQGTISEPIIEEGGLYPQYVSICDTAKQESLSVNKKLYSKENINDINDRLKLVYSDGEFKKIKGLYA